ncbi:MULTISPECIES: YcnI family protein [unclassified Mesorhizobium]|uniref:YcnI family copper-binding membrane protein n=1 Tax=unclassified Mesorhizobium TaxID=325217 RepID=UPI00112D7B48|nr:MULTISPECIES: YcnI family protein [unclassified Mesorhizobium]TPL04407.1 YcnI family protein [Mesorhizobium sp. B2-4-14]UCI30062.1 YcnI family protein [Mesorhizobium sp. B4-1-4]
MNKYLLAAGTLLVLGTNAASAHITLETQEAAVGSTYKAVLRVPHGCDGKATTAVRVQIPEGVIAVKPMPKPSWTLQTKKGKYEKSYQLYDQAVTDGVKEVDWSGGSLPDEFYDEFVFRATLTADLPVNQKLYFPVVQECDGASERWIEIPAAGQDEDALENPAPGIKLTPKK